MPKAQVNIERASKLPLLGIKSQPSPFVYIVECQNDQYISPICKYTQNPYWNFNFTIQAKESTSYVHFYVYNNNTNGVDELLAYGRLEMGQLLTQTNSHYQLKLVNSLEERIQSYIFLEHFDANPKDVYLPLSERSCIQLKLIKPLPEMHELLCEYGRQSFILLKELSQNTFHYSSQELTIRFTLRNKDKLNRYELDSQLLVRNITQNGFFMLRFYETSQDIFVYFSASVVLNGLLPENHNVLGIKFRDVSKNSNSKVTNYQLRVGGPLNSSLVENNQAKIYIENNSFIVIDYFEDVQNIEGAEPYCCFKVPVNSLNWQNQRLKASHIARYFDAYKNIETVLDLELRLEKNSELSKVIPKLNPPENQFDDESTVLINQLKISNCFLYEVIKQTNVGLIHVDKYGYARATKRFTIKDNKTEYLVNTKLTLKEGGKGQIYLISHDHHFDDNSARAFTNRIIFKVIIDKYKDFEEPKIEFNNKFLAYAKKQSVVKISKKFNQMVHDSLCVLKVKSQLSGQLDKGYLKLVNIKCDGIFGDVEANIVVDGVQFKGSGLIGSYLLERPYSFDIDEGRIGLEVQLSNVALKQEQKINQNVHSYCWHGRVQDLLGTPLKGKTYTSQIKISSSHRLQIIYEYQQQEKRIKHPVKKAKDLSLFTGSNDMILKLKSATIPVDSHSYKFSVSRGTYSYDSLRYKTSNNCVLFNPNQEVRLAVQGKQQQELLFFNAYSHDEQDNLMIYNGYINTKELVGKGSYEVVLVYQKQQKVIEIILIFQITHSQCISAHSVKLNLEQLQLNRNLPLLRSTYKYYILIKINNCHSEIIECNMADQVIINLKSEIVVWNRDFIDFQLYSSYKAISKELFYGSEKQMIANRRIYWEQLEQQGCFMLDFHPKKQSQFKNNKNCLTLLQKSIKLLLSYKTEPFKADSRPEVLTFKKSNIDLDVLSGGVAKIFLKDCMIAYTKGTVMKLEIPEIGLELTTQSNFKINREFYVEASNMRIQLTAILTLKQQQKYIKKVLKANINLRGNHYKNNQLFSLNISFEDMLKFTSNCTIFSNKFTNLPAGAFVLNDLTFRGVKLDKVEVAFVSSPAQKGQIEYQIKKTGNQLKNINEEFKTDGLLNGLLFMLEVKGNKHRFYISLAELNIEKYEDQQTYQKQVLIGGSGLVVSLGVSYMHQKQQEKLTEKIVYKILGESKEKQVTIDYNSKQMATYSANNKSIDFPKRTKGYLLKVTIPGELAERTKDIQLLLESGQKVTASYSVTHPNEFIYHADKALKVSNIRLLHPELFSKTVQPLGESKGVLKFMIDQNCKHICSLESFPKNISNIGEDQWIVKFKLHRLMSLCGKRLLRLKNTVHDQVLTKNLAVMVKHCDQYHLVFDFDQFGNSKQTRNIDLQFGYNTSSDILEIYLIVDNYFNRRYQNDTQRLMNNWMELMPISYAKIDISDITKDSQVGVELQPVANNSMNLEKTINNIIIRQANIFALGTATFEKKAWGFLNIKLEDTTGLVLEGKEEKQSVYIYYKIEVEDPSRNIVNSLTTEARAVSNQQDIKFTNSLVETFLIQQNREAHYNIKITAILLKASSHISLFEKRQDITDYLNRRGQSTLNIQIKPNQTNNLCKNSFQLTFSIRSSDKKSEGRNLIEKAKQINRVDALSFRDMSDMQFLQKLVACENVSHFYQSLQEIKESFIYTQDPQTLFFIMLCQYLNYNFDQKIIGFICEIIQITFLKAPAVMVQMQANGTLEIMYFQLKTICKRQTAKIPDKIVTVEHEQFKQQFEQFVKVKTLEVLRQTIQKQKYRLFSGEKLIQAPTYKWNQLILNIIHLMIRSSPMTRRMFSNDIEEWIEMFGFTERMEQFEIFMVIFKTALSCGLTLDQKVQRKWIDILIQKVYNLSFVFDFWDKIKDKGTKLDYYKDVIFKYIKEYEANPVDACRGTKMMLGQLYNPKHSEEKEKYIKLHEQFVKVILNLLPKHSEIMVLSSNIDMLVYFNDLKLLEEPQRVILAQIVKEKAASLKENSSKLILSSFIPKLNKKQEINFAKKDGKNNEMSKMGFRGKYLITSD